MPASSRLFAVETTEPNLFAGTPTPAFNSADDFARNPTLALEYLKSRWPEFHCFMTDLRSTEGDLGYALVGRSMFENTQGMFARLRDSGTVIRFANMHCCAAYLMAKFW